MQLFHKEKIYLTVLLYNSKKEERMKLMKQIRGEQKQMTFDELDLSIYKTLYDYIQQCSILKNMQKKNYVFFLLKCWYYASLRVQEERLGEQRSETVAELEEFYHVFQKHTSFLDTHHINEILYRFPWHLGNLCLHSKGKQIDLNYLQNLSLSKEQVDLCYAAPYERVFTLHDEYALQFLSSYQDKNKKALCSIHLKANIPLMIYTIENGISKSLVSEQNTFSYSMIHQLKSTVKEEKKGTKYFLFQKLMITLFMICYWHMDMQYVQRSWYYLQPDIRFFAI